MTEGPRRSGPALGSLVWGAGLRVRVGGRPVLRGVDFSLQPGALAVVLGGNGAGKTTLLKTLAGFLRPLRGDISWFGGFDLVSRPEARSRIGYLGHEPLLYEDLSAYENILFFANLYGLSSPHRRVNQALEGAGLWDRRGDPPRRFSRGMRGRLSLARATLHKPDLLLLDEPDSGLDEGGRAWLGKILEGHRAGGGATLIATHDAGHFQALNPLVMSLSEGILKPGGLNP